jgi:hypothetical protein
MSELRLGIVAFGAAFLVSGCAHDPPPRAPPAEEPIVMAPAAANAKPLPEIDPNKPLAHAKEVDTNTCIRRGRSTVCR